MIRRKFLRTVLGAIASLPFIEAAPLLLEEVEDHPLIGFWQHPDGSWVRIEAEKAFGKVVQVRIEKSFDIGAVAES